ncbi:ZN629 protein, partial [Prunella fulvescens]|nr:ZN629 protein [Prunella fulvescens]
QATVARTRASGPAPEACGKSFSWNLHLVQHCCTHTREKQYRCGHCSRSFSWSSKLIKHQRTHASA